MDFGHAPEDFGGGEIVPGFRLGSFQMDSVANNVYSDHDSVMGTATRIPRLIKVEGFAEWKYRFEQYIKMKDVKLWRMEEYYDLDFERVEPDEKALATLSMALSPEITQGFHEYKSAKALWDVLIDVYEGNDDMKQSMQDLFRQRFNMFNHVLRESLEAQLQCFITLNTEMTTAGITLSKTEVNKKLLNSLPRSWDMNVTVIKKS
ncbi:hypothetical protein L2E82_10306 [Cichorium intybus]|uniref:Uncharacterized protein n=1 Tax=Cichorium intybus TaxID=13427 RepID=A0ACB9GA11_CICIN|nr:hypothetical protein L2E82_10306 [Cichorium intybus]